MISRLPTALVVLLLVGPLLAGLAGTLLPAFGYLPALGGQELSLRPLRDLFATPGIFRSIGLSLGTGLAATVVSLAITMLFVASWMGTPAFKLVRRLLSPLLAVPHAAAAFGLAFLIAPSGFLVRLMSPWATGFDRPPDLLILNDPFGMAMTLGLIMKEVPFLFLMTLAVLPQTDSFRKMKVTATLGYGRTAGFLKACLPEVYSRIRLPVLAVLVYSTSVVDMAQILGPTTPAPLAPRIMGWMADPDPAIRFQASAAALLQLALSGLALLIWFLLERIARGLGHSVSGKRRRHDRLFNLSVLAGMSIVVGGMFAGILLLPIWSVTKSWWFPDSLPAAFTTKLWTGLGEVAGAPLLTTLAIGIPASLIAGALVLWHLEANTRARGVSSAEKAAFDGFVFLPLLVPQVSFLFGLQVLFARLHLDGTMFAVGLGHLIFVLPYVYLSLKDPWNELDPRFAKIASSLGSSANRIFLMVRLPLLLRPLLVALAVGLAVSVGQYLPTLMIGAGRVVTITTESLALSSGGNRPLIALYGTLQLLVPLIGFSAAAAIPALLFRKRAAMKVIR
ncbi:ABC transporter permease subunit [uncultured Roseibium sp.]|uniref:ABC transporter permease n=1 Tax=uncultured Roseibium sp. TaxID=1936171 RepID=UPI002595C463|nr:ABC transporter permease subunit [uncultured Roseibium sp.]